MLPWDIPDAFERKNIEQAPGRGCFAEKLQRRQKNVITISAYLMPPV
jgi:hypothetical protein